MAPRPFAVLMRWSARATAGKMAYRRMQVDRPVRLVAVQVQRDRGDRDWVKPRPSAHNPTTADRTHRIAATAALHPSNEFLQPAILKLPPGATPARTRPGSALSPRSVEDSRHCRHFARQGDSRQAAEQRCERHLPLNAGERSAKAEMDAKAEGDMVVGAAGRYRADPESGKCSGSRLRRQSLRRPARAAGSSCRQFRPRSWSPGGALHRRVVAKQLLHRAGDERRLGLQPRSWSGCRNSANRPLPIKLTVVSWPAMKISTQVASSSSSLSLSPSSSRRSGG